MLWLTPGWPWDKRSGPTSCVSLSGMSRALVGMDFWLLKLLNGTFISSLLGQAHLDCPSSLSSVRHESGPTSCVSLSGMSRALVGMDFWLLKLLNGTFISLVVPGLTGPKSLCVRLETQEI